MKSRYQKAIDKLNNAKNDMKFRYRTEQDLIRMKEEKESGNITYEEYYDLQWFYWETWIDPITVTTPHGSIILN